MLPWPSKIGGSHRLAGWLNRFVDRSRAAEVKQIIGGRFIETSDGKILVVDTGAAAGGAVTGPYRLKSVEDDYLVCKLWDGTTEGEAASDASADVYIAKAHKLRHSITTETIEGVVYTYTYETGPTTTPTISNKLRVATAAGVVIERCIVTPEWLVNDLVWAMRATTTVFRTPPTDDPVRLLMVPDGRAWALHA